MTCIVGLVHGGSVYMGGDSAGVSGWDLRVRADAKVFRRQGGLGGPWVFGFTSSFRMGQLIAAEQAELARRASEEEPAAG